MGRLSLETRSKVITMWVNCYPVSVIQKRLLQEGVSISKVSLLALFKKLKNPNQVVDIKHKLKSSLLAECHHRYIDEVMMEDNELTSR